jgi:hypothetical protein
MTATFTPEEEVQRIQAEPAALQQKLRKIHCVLASRDIAADEISNLLTEFEGALRLYFESEAESEGFFEQVTAHAPQLINRADRLCIEHDDLLHQATELCRFAAAGSPSLAWWRELRCRCHEFSKQLMHHETGEHELLQKAYQDDIGTKD